jgi:tetraacyldisaccharide 4'-kinase
VRWLARWLRDQGVPVAILSYGYRAGSEEAVTVVSDGTRVMVPESVSGDEPRMLADALPGVPVLIGKRRQLSAAEAVRRFGTRVCVLDDAFQYWRLVKDLDIVLIDAACPFGGGHLLPRGLLRERTRELRRAQVMVITNGHRLPEERHTNLRRRVERLSPGAVLAEARHAPRALRALKIDADGEGNAARHPGEEQGSPCGLDHPPSLEALRGRRVLALSSLGNPDGFERTLEELGAEVVSAPYPDHHHYRPEEVRAEARRARAAECVGIVTTEKDAVKIDPGWANPVPVWALSVEMEFDTGRRELEARLTALLA